MQRVFLAGMAALILSSCGLNSAVKSATAAPSIAPTSAAPNMRWGDSNPEWTAAALEALNDEGIMLLSTVPSDVLQFCPGYASQSKENRAAFWAGLISSISRHESTHNASAKGAGGRYLGLMQISKPTAKANGCGGSLLHGPDNLRCTVRIMAKHVARDKAIVGGKGGWRGVARDWMPLRSSSKRADIAGWTKKQSYCQ